MKNFNLPAMSDMPQFFTTMTNSKKFSERFCLLSDSFLHNSANAQYIVYNSTGYSQTVSKRDVPVDRTFKDNKLSMKYHDPDLDMLSGNYTVLSTDEFNYAILGACLEDFDRPFIKVMAWQRHMSLCMRNWMESTLLGLGLDLSTFIKMNGKLCADQ
ncbi:uncharacterized protein [Periplaneta americana]|uniref:uncharacterized protein n=1 Tax=Periplaneta americana TaxID=6978 RepID=UPI0037E8ACB3